MLAAILSDSLLFKSPTSTQKDKEICEELKSLS
jgi:inorganic pyrophosphatase/exopolyphosphatase